MRVFRSTDVTPLFFGLIYMIHSFGASLSYASCDGQSGASSPQILSDTMIPDGTEIVIMSDKSCNDGGCGYTRPNSVSYRELRMRRDQ